MSTFTRPSRLEVGDHPRRRERQGHLQRARLPVQSCSFKLKSNKVGLLSSFSKSKLRSGTEIVVLVVASDALGRYVSYAMRKTDVQNRVRACVEPGGTVREMISTCSVLVLIRWRRVQICALDMCSTF